MTTPLKVALAYNSIPEHTTETERNQYLERYEWDDPSTIHALVEALERPGNEVIPIEAVVDERTDVYLALKEARPDIVFNFAEGDPKIQNREAMIPMFCDVLGLPYTASGAKTLSIGMDKASTIEILLNYGLNIPQHYVFEREEDLGMLDCGSDSMCKLLESRVVVKPVGEGTGIGMDQNSVTDNAADLKAAIMGLIRDQHKPALVQPFLGGTEYTVGILGNLVLPILKLDLRKIPGNPKIRDPAVKEINPGTYASAAPFSPLYQQLATQAAITHSVLDCDDYSRVDFRLDSNGKPYFLEINSLPGLIPHHSDYSLICELAGIPYDVMVNAMLYQAILLYQPRAKYAGRFSSERVSYLKEFVAPTMDSLEKYDQEVSFNCGTELQPDVASSKFYMVKAKEAIGRQKG